MVSTLVSSALSHKDEISSLTMQGAITGAEAPFGGVKASGYGKEAGKDVAVEEYLVTKAISVAVESRL